MHPQVSPHQNPARETLRVTAWVDPVVDANGHPVDDPYIEMFWLPVLGPTATWLYRRLVAALPDDPCASCDIDVGDLARSIGVSHTAGRHNPFARALQRCIMFGVAQQVALQPVHTVAVRRVLPTLARRHLQRLPDPLQVAHHDWMHVPTARSLPRREAPAQ